MRQAYRWTALPALCVLSACLLSACGGGGGSKAAAQAEHNFSGGGANVVPVSVGPGPADQAHQTFNIPYVSVTVCAPDTGSCATINDVLVDTGSSGLRLMASVLAANGLSLPAAPGPANSANTIHECLPFADGYAWGAVSDATVKIGGEATASAIPVEVIDDSATPTPAAPSSCSQAGTALNSVDAFDANGVLGVSSLNQDCGSSCAQSAQYDVYYSCTAAGDCQSIIQAAAAQVANPVASFPTDNNGVILQLPSISAAGAATASGYLVFGIGTQSNNGLGSAKVLTTDTNGFLITTFQQKALDNSFIDSGSNGLYFPNTASPITLCGDAGTDAADFYCPSATVSLTASNQGQNGTTSSVSFQIANLKNIGNSYFALDDVGGPAPQIAGWSYFDWGLPFFYGRTVFTALEGTTAGGIEGPFYAY
jgi:hypothetical protein